MPPVLEFSICGNPDQDTTALQSLLAKFRRQAGILPTIELRLMPWDDYKQELTAMAIHKRGLDVSQVGAPAVNDLLAMHSLRPFHPREVTALGGEAAFAPAAWHSSQRLLEGKVWAIPWMADPRAILYWRDLVEAAGVEESTAFQTIDHFANTLSRLQAHGVTYPWMMNTQQKFNVLQTMSSWLWAAGGDFISPDGKQAKFLQPEALAGLQACFELSRYFPPQSLANDWDAAQQLFLERKTAVTISGVGMAHSYYHSLPPEQRNLLGAALPLGQPFVGGSSLVIWSNTVHDEAAVKLVQFLVSPEIQQNYPLTVGHLPVRNDILNSPPYTTDSILQGYVTALRQGRLFPVTPLGGMLEEQLGSALVRTMQQYLADPGLDLAATLRRSLGMIARRFDNWMS